MTLATQFTPTIMQKLLGRQYKWWFLGVYTTKQNFNYIWNEIFTSFYRFIWLIGVITLGTHQGENQSLVNYILIGSLFFAISEGFMSWQIGEEIKTGHITKLLMYPTNILTNYIVQGLFKCFYVGVSYFPWLILLYIMYRPDISENISRWWVFPVMFFASWFIRLMFDMITSFGSFWIVEFIGLSYLNYNLVGILSGSLFPLDYLSSDIYNIVIYTPFAFTFYHPMQIYLGKYDTAQTLLVFAGGIAWCIFLYFLAKFIFKLGLKRNEAVGL
jgi:ABC-2 type transport system permease protein